MKRQAAGIARWFDASRHALRGLGSAWRREAAFRQEVVLAAILMPVSFWLGRTPAETAMLGSSLLLVLVVELVNSALEAAIDRVGREFHPLAGAAKDIGSAAVFVSLLLTAFVWISIAGARLPA